MGTALDLGMCSRSLQWKKGGIHNKRGKAILGKHTSIMEVGGGREYRGGRDFTSWFQIAFQRAQFLITTLVVAPDPAPQ